VGETLQFISKKRSAAWRLVLSCEDQSWLDSRRSKGDEYRRGTEMRKNVFETRMRAWRTARSRRRNSTMCWMHSSGNVIDRVARFELSAEVKDIQATTVRKKVRGEEEKQEKERNEMW